jgi:hypothetical protein
MYVLRRKDIVIHIYITMESSSTYACNTGFAEECPGTPGSLEQILRLSHYHEHCAIYYRQQWEMHVQRIVETSEGVSCTGST